MRIRSHSSAASKKSSPPDQEPDIGANLGGEAELDGPGEHSTEAEANGSNGGDAGSHQFAPVYRPGETPGLNLAPVDSSGGASAAGTSLDLVGPKPAGFELEAGGRIDASALELYRQLLKDSATPVAELMTRRGFTEDDIDELLSTLGRQYGMEVVRARAYKMTPELIAAVDREIAKKYHCVPLERIGDHLTIAITDPWDLQTQDDLRNIFRAYDLHIVLADQREVSALLAKYYTGETQQIGDAYTEAVRDMEEEAAAGGDLDSYIRSLEDVDLDTDDTPIVKLVNLVMQEALRARASDIHFECYQHSFKVRFRVDGVLQDRNAPEKRLQGAIITRLKIMAGMDVAEHRIPQDGRIQVRIDGKPIDFRVSALPSIHGESIVLRLLDKAGLMLGLDQIGFLPDSVEQFNEIIRRPNGIVLITGPTGSGKTTTLYSALNTINSVDTKIITVENPVEYQLDGINQVQVAEDVGLTFALALRTILRQSPDVILIGEIRDRETGEIAVRSALTGHLVFSTLHTNDAPSAATRLVEMGLKPFLVASSLQAVIAQRLIRIICKECKEAYRPSVEELLAMGLDPDENANLRLYRGRGCAACQFTGYRGRTAIFEIMDVSEEIRELILEHGSSDQLRDLAREQGMRTLREDGWKKVLRGDTTVLEVARVTQTDRD